MQKSQVYADPDPQHWFVDDLCLSSSSHVNFSMIVAGPSLQIQAITIQP
jgi:hypothetical protein